MATAQRARAEDAIRRVGNRPSKGAQDDHARDPPLSSWRVKDHRQTAGSLRLLTLGVHQVRGDSGASERGAIDVLEKEIGGFPPGAGLDMRMHSRSAF